MGQSDRHLGRLGERALGVRGDGDQGHGEAPRIGDEIAELDGLAGPGEGENDVVAGDHAEIAVARLAGVHEIGWRPRGGEGARDFLPDMAALAHAGDDDAAAAAADHGDGVGETPAEVGAERCLERAQALGFELYRPRRRRDGFADVLARKKVALKTHSHD